MDKRHIGNGLYIEYDGTGLILTTEYGENVTSRIYLVPGMLDAMTQYNRDVAAEIRKNLSDSCTQGSKSTDIPIT